MIKNPQYTGENRCYPCTIINIFILLIGVVFLIFLHPLLALTFAIGGGTLIWLRGYLIPGTPTVTKQYFPNWLLAKFDKDSGLALSESDSRGFDAEEVLLEADVLTPCVDSEDLCLTNAFQDTWENKLDEIERTSSTKQELSNYLDVPSSELLFESKKRGLVVYRNASELGEWDSKAALMTDLASAQALSSQLEGWDSIARRNRGELLMSLRIFLETCPACAGQIAMDMETVETCCSTRDVLAVTCSACNDQVLEIPYSNPR